MTVQYNYEILGSILKLARKKSGLTAQAIAEKADICERYLYQLEDGSNFPSYENLYKLIRILSIQPDVIFYPEKTHNESEIENLIRMLYQCDERSLEVLKATAKALIDTADEKQLVHT